MSIVVPAILPTSREELDAALARLVPIGGVETVQIDIVDGRFAKPASWPYAKNEEWELPHADRFRYDLDLMVLDPDRLMARLVECGASRITLHVESMISPKQSIATFKKRYGHEAHFTPGLLSLGLALGMSTPLSVIEPFLADIDYVQLMGIANIGRQGERFDPRVLPKIRALRATHKALPIQIDGGVSLESAPLLLAAGATRLVVGSALLRTDNISVAFDALEQLGDRFGTYERSQAF